MKKEGLIGVRLTEQEMEKLDIHTSHLSRSQIVRALIQDFLEKSEDQQREFLIKSFFGK